MGSAQMRIAALGLGAGLVCVSGSCGRPGDAARGARMDTSATAAAAVGNGTLRAADAAAPWRLVEDLRLGGADAEGPGSFARIRSIEVDRAGRIYVLEAQPERISVFGPDGRFVRYVGRAGSGPGEYAQAGGMAWDTAGRLWVVNQQNARYTVFDTSGAFAFERRRPVTTFSTWRWAGTITDRGQVIEVTMVPGDRDFGLMLLPLDSSLAVRDTVRLPDFVPPVFRIDRGGSHAAYSIPFAPQLTWTLDPAGDLWYAITDRYRIVHVTQRGDTALVITKAYQPVRVTDAEKDEAARNLSGFVRQGGVVDRSRFPDVKPALASFVLDDRGYVWVRTDGAEASSDRFDVFDAAGRYLGTLPVPPRVGSPVLVRGTYLYAVARDEDDVPNVVRYRIAGR